IIDEGYKGLNFKDTGYLGLENIEKLLNPAIRALTRAPRVGFSVRDALIEASTDPDVEVRLGVRRTLEEMARARRFLSDLRNALPPLESLGEKKDKEPEKIDPPKEDKDKKGKDKNKKKDEEVSRRGGRAG